MYMVRDVPVDIYGGGGLWFFTQGRDFFFKSPEGKIFIFATERGRIILFVEGGGR